jgi:hypothetical protein
MEARAAVGAPMAGPPAAERIATTAVIYYLREIALRACNLDDLVQSH